MTWTAILSLGKATAKGWDDHKVSRLSAALAYYTLLSLAPLLIVVVSVTGLVFGQQGAREHLAAQLEGLAGATASRAIQDILANAQSPRAGIWGTIVGLGGLLFGASGVFGELQDALNVVWSVEPKPGRGMWGVIRDRFFSFTMVLGVAFLLLVSLVLSTALAAIGHVLTDTLPGGESLWHLINAGISLAVFASLFGLIYKVIPDVKLAWRDVWVGGLFTALLFTVGKTLLGLYLGKSSMTSPYGAAGSVVLLVVWVYYSAQILFLGAEFTRAYAVRDGSPVQPADNAVIRTADEARADPAKC